MPWLETDVRDQRIQFVMTAQRADANLSAVCRAFGISRKTGYKWLAREAAAGSVAVLGDRSRRPHRSPRRTSAVITARVGALRSLAGWGGAKLAVLLAAEGIELSARTIDRIIQREGWTRRDAAPAPAPKRFERTTPNELWQMDAKGAYPVGGGRCHALSVLDDHSRFAVGLVALPTLETTGVQRALVQTFEAYGLPEALLMDHGTPWWSTKGSAGLTALGVFLLKQGIRLVYGAVRHPQTQGKVERFHRTLAERLRWAGVPTTIAGFRRTFAWFRDEYNFVRPHAALRMEPPGLHFRPSPRAYQPTPPPWIYPPGMEVRTVRTNGQVTIAGTSFFISHALCGEQVGCVRHDERLLVSYRHMYVRELHPRSGAAVSLMQPIDRPMEAAGAVDVKTTSTAPWKTQRTRFPQPPQAP